MPEHLWITPPNTPGTSLSRRRFVGVVGGLAAGAAVGSLRDVPALAAPATRATSDVFETMRVRCVGLLTGGDFDGADPDFAAAVAQVDETATAHRDLVDRSADRDRVFADLPLAVEDSYDASARVSTTLIRLEQLAVAYRTPGSAFEGDAGLLADVLAGMDTANRVMYHAGREEFGNWYHWEIAGPNALMNTCVLVSAHVPAEALARYIAAVDHFIPDPHYQYIDERRKPSTDSNRMHLCRAVLLRGVLGRSTEKIELSRAALTDVFGYVTSGVGFYADGSYRYHNNLAYTGSYGLAFIDQFSDQLVLYGGSPWELTGTEADFAFGTVDRAFAPVVYNGQVLDFVRGRAISRYTGGGEVGLLATEIVLRLADATDVPTGARWRAMAKGWLARNGSDDPLAGGTIPRIALFKDVLGDPAVVAAPEPVHHVLFANMDRAVHRRRGWAYAIAMSSLRIGRYETMNGENPRGWHTGEGMTSLCNGDSGQFTDGFWPTVDPKRLPGTTVDSWPLADGEGRGGSVPDRPWAGGAVLDSEFAVVGMELQAIQSPLRAKKSWFCLDDAVVALGAEITGGGGYYLKPVADAHVNGGANADVNYGSDDRVLVKTASPDGTRQAYFRFDLADVPSRIEQATFFFRGRVTDSGGGETDLDVHALDGDWAENTVTWNSRPSLGERLATVPASTERWMSADVTDHVRRLVDSGTARVDLGLAQDEAGLSVQIWSRERQAYNPYLQLRLAEPVATVETVVENRNLHSDGANRLVVDGQPQPSNQGWSRRFEDVRWAHLEGVGGYLFPGGTALYGLREERTGSWRDINAGGPTDELTRRYLTLWLDHGPHPGNGAYAYVVVPGASVGQTAELARDPGLKILRNTGDRQAMWSPRLGITAVSFWRPGTERGIAVDAPCSVIVRERAGKLTVAVADATHVAEAVTVRIDRRGYRDWTAADRITVQHVSPQIEFHVNLSGAMGATQTVTFT